ncbi:GntR family transcriptional regulator [uncultured Roseibium sp.]|uniref:GntR family transcriptional regulator n=1 Tax=uncultured Roseibium sp. TaxID=1936171 RepID=UPI00262150DF|nr:GntR family transcriptional regulator [uncultured Roseibium sp.]
MRTSGVGDIEHTELDPDRPAGNQIFLSLRDAILNMELPPGCTLSESEIGLRFGASRTPVRSALTQLREQGLIVTRPSRGNYVAKLSEKKIRAAQFIRECLELGIVRRLCEYGIPEKDDEKLTAVLERQRQAIEDPEKFDFYKQDEAFHNGLATATGMEQVHLLYKREMADLGRLRHLGMDDEAHKKQLLSEHLTMLNAIRERDRERAEAVMQTHVRCVLGKLSGLMNANQDFFA